MSNPSVEIMMERDLSDHPHILLAFGSGPSHSAFFYRI